MSRRRAVLTGAASALLLLVDLGLSSLVGAAHGEPGLHPGWLSLGLAAGLMMTMPARWRSAAAALVSVVAGAWLTLAFDVAWWQGASVAASVAVPSVLVASWLSPDTEAMRRYRDGEMDEYHARTAYAAMICAAIDTLVAMAGQPHALGQEALHGLVVFIAGLNGQLVVLPFVVRDDGLPPWRVGVELWSQRVLAVVFVALILLPQTQLHLAFVLFPVLGWCALRGTVGETHLQVSAVCVTAYVATALGRGPFSAGFDWMPADLRPSVVYLFMASLLYLVVPLTLTVERFIAMTRQATSAATTVERLLDSAEGTVFLATDPQGFLTHYNIGAEQALGYSADEVIGRHIEMFHTTEEISRHAEHFGVSAEGKIPLHAVALFAQLAAGGSRDWEFRRKDGAIRTISLHLSTITATRDVILGYIGSGEDITDRVRAEQALEQAFDREQASVRALREADHVKRELVSTVSHELRTPLTSINGYVEMLSDGSLGEVPAQQLEVIRRIEQNGERLRGLVEDLLTLSQSESGRLELVRHPLDLRDVVYAAHELLMHHRGSRELEVVVELPRTPVMTSGDRRMLERVAINLLTNALKFTPDGGRIRASVTEVTDDAGEPRALIEVEDSGIGIAADDLEQLFTRFFRADAATQNAIQGTGLGLSIVQAIVQEHDGSVSVRSTPGCGSVFGVSLPLLDVSGAEGRSGASLAEESRAVPNG